LTAALGHGQITFRVFEERIELEADVAIVAVGLAPDRLEDLLGLAHEHVGQLPGDIAVGEAGTQMLLERLIEAAGLDEVGDDDRIGGRARGAPGAILTHEVRVDRIEPEFGSGRDQGLQRTGHGMLPRLRE
jgi:hypothetical protein